MIIKAQIVVMSHLSDIDTELGFNISNNISSRINFVKFIIMKCNGDLNIEINPDELWNEFKNQG